jgi:hypothetical protein
MKLRYVGSVVTTFITGNVGEVEPGDEFTVSDELAPAFLARVDVEEVVEDEPAPSPVPATPVKPLKKEPSQSAQADDAEGPRE